MKKFSVFSSLSLCLSVMLLLLGTSCQKNSLLEDQEDIASELVNTLSGLEQANTSTSLRKVGYLSLHATGSDDYAAFMTNFVTSQYTDIIISFINPDASGNFAITPSITQAINIAHNAGLRVFFGTATHDSNGNANTQINTNRSNFISKIRRFLTDNNIDGIDLDFEGAGLTTNFSPFVVQLSDSLRQHSKLLSVAIARWQANNISNAAYNRVDFLNVMSYDHSVTNGNPKPHSSYADFVTDINIFSNKVPKAKINMGIPTYAWVYENGTPMGQIGFNNVLQQVATGYCLNYVAPTSSRKLYYDGHPAIRQKVPYVLEQGIGGIMIWHVLSDTQDDATSIIKFINFCETNPSGFYPGTYRINNTNSGKTLQIEGSSDLNGAYVVQGVGDALGTNLWRFNLAGNGRYGIINNFSNKGLDILAASTAVNASLIQWAWWNQAQNQLFKLVSDDVGFYTITAVHSNLPIQIQDASVADGAKVVQAAANGSYNQKWMIWR